MTTENVLSQPPDTTNWPKFAFICDGEVADIMVFPPDAERWIAVLSSNPTVVRFESGVKVGDSYVDGEFGS